MALFLGVDTEIKWIDDLFSIPIIGGFLTVLLAIVPAVILSFVLQPIIPTLNNDIGFTKIMLVLVPAWNIALWIMKIRAYIFFIPSWILFVTIAIVKGYLMYNGIDDGQ